MLRDMWRMTDHMRQCLACHEWLPLSEFKHRITRGDSRASSRCHKCWLEGRPIDYPALVCPDCGKPFKPLRGFNVKRCPSCRNNQTYLKKREPRVNNNFTAPVEFTKSSVCGKCPSLSLCRREIKRETFVPPCWVSSRHYDPRLFSLANPHGIGCT